MGPRAYCAALAGLHAPHTPQARYSAANDIVPSAEFPHVLRDMLYGVRLRQDRYTRWQIRCRIFNELDAAWYTGSYSPPDKLMCNTSVTSLQCQAVSDDGGLILHAANVGQRVTLGRSVSI